ncbi:uncharacterized protein LOC126647556 [Myiozetetes cayanensis]|uniref:uncharacterized protein LOC126647556 n=1 Tax=Myiozetetes cayanensis TaxID=478635 RepID=UPI00215EBF03|nr:uncharacterized protein LOC126647556 [Myiozetetes cayanensis]
MAVKNGIKSQGDISCLRDLTERGDELLHLKGVLAVAAGRAEELRSARPAGETARHTDSCCLHRESPGSGHSLADGQVCKNTGLGCSLSRNSLLSQQADTPRGQDDSSGSAAVLEIDTEKRPGVSDDFSDDDLEYFECSDVLTARENEKWQKKLRFLLESDDEDDLKLSQDCDGCARLLGEAPRAAPVSGDAAPVETPIGFWGHHSELRGLGVRGDPSVCSQSPVQADMTPAVGHHRQRSSGPKGSDDAPVASAAAADERPRSRGEADASGHLAAKARQADPAPAAAPAEAAPCAGSAGAAGTMTGAGAARGESSPLMEERGRDVPEENPQHAGCAFTETLRRNLFKLLNPLELCRYVSTIGQSLQAAAEGRESTAPSPAREGVLIAKETGSLEVQAEEADKDCPWERRRTQGPPEQNQMLDENVPLEVSNVLIV